MDNKVIHQEIDLIEATIAMLQERCYTLRKMVGGVRAPSTARKGKQNEAVAKVLANRERTIQNRQKNKNRC